MTRDEGAGAGTSARSVDPGHWVEHLTSHLAMAREGKDPEGVHQVRVAGRRLRVWLLLGGHRALEDDLRWLVSVLGRVRDLDVLRAMPVGGGPLEPHALPHASFADWLAEQHHRARADAELVLDSFRVEGLCRALGLLRPLDEEQARSALHHLEADVARRERAWLQAPGWRNAARPGVQPAAPPETPPAAEGIDELHRLRRALRRLRYAKEWLGERDHRLSVLQDVFGSVCDVAAMLRLLDTFCAETHTTAPVTRAALVDALAAMMKRAHGGWLVR